jgi:hypothetical protein
MNINKWKKESFHVKEEEKTSFYFQNIVPIDLWVCQ